jgi:hypothetical protein
MRVVVLLVNGSLHVHQADCGEVELPFGGARILEAASYEDVAGRCYGRYLGRCMDMGEALDCLTFGACTAGLTYAALVA